MNTGIVTADKEELEWRMAQAGMTCSELAAEIGLSENIMCQIIDGEVGVAMSVAEKICEAFRCDFEDIFHVYIYC